MRLYAGGFGARLPWAEDVNYMLAFKRSSAFYDSKWQKPHKAGRICSQIAFPTIQPAT